MNEVGCNCNGALYLVSMPAYNSGQQPNPGKDGSYYCDANQVGGTYCPEMDVMEANKYAMASTAHTCNYIAPHYYSYCDRGGCGTNVLNQHGNEFGPGKASIPISRSAFRSLLQKAAMTDCHRFSTHFSKGVNPYRSMHATVTICSGWATVYQELR